MTDNASTPRTFVHRYPWRAEEITIITVLFLGPLAVSAVLGTLGTLGSILVATPAAFLGGFLGWLGHTRKKRSTLVATQTGTTVAISRPNEPKKPVVSFDLTQIAAVRGHDLHRLDPSLVLEAPENAHGSTKSTYVPLRIAKVMAEVLAPALDGARVHDSGADLVAQVRDAR